MELTFEKVGNQYVAEFQAPSDFNLHIEREEIGVFEVHQRGSEEGKYDFAWGTGVNGRKVVDYDFGALVYPKYIKVVSGSEVVSASVNFNEGGGSGSGSGDGEDSWIYYDVRGIDNEILTEVLGFGDMYPLMLHTKSTSYNGETVHFIKSLVRYQADMENVLYVALDIKWKAYYSVIEGTLPEFIETAGLTELFSSIPRITKEQFYSIEA